MFDISRVVYLAVVPDPPDTTTIGNHAVPIELLVVTGLGFFIVYVSASSPKERKNVRLFI